MPDAAALGMAVLLILLLLRLALPDWLAILGVVIDQRPGLPFARATEGWTSGPAVVVLLALGGLAAFGFRARDLGPPPRPGRRPSHGTTRTTVTLPLPTCVKDQGSTRSGGVPSWK